MDEDVIAFHKKLAKSLCKLLSGSGEFPLKASISAGEFTFHYSIENNIDFISICDKSYPRLLAFSFLTEVSKGFSDEVKSSSQGWSGVTSIVRPYAFIRFEPFIQSTRKRYQNTRQLKPQEDLVELSSRIQSIPVLRAEDVFGSEFTRSAAGGGGNAFPSMDTLKKTANSISSAIHDAASEGLPNTGRGRGSFVPTYIFYTSLAIFAIDFLSLLNYLLPGWLSTWAPSSGFQTLFIICLGILSPFLCLQAYLIRSSSGILPLRLADVSTIHALLTVCFILFALLGSGGSSPLPPAPASVTTAEVSPLSVAGNVTSQNSNDTIAAVSNATEIEPPTQAAAALVSMTVMSFWVLLLRLLYIFPVLLYVGVGTFARWAGRRGPKGRKD
ncbi:SNAP receptor [Phlyctochytrium planicorne]|nr:SNAP receptor [Phlyctochytrium planicorne]